MEDGADEMGCLVQACESSEIPASKTVVLILWRLGQMSSLLSVGFFPTCICMGRSLLIVASHALIDISRPLAIQV
jgi:hypothetical protein